MKHRLPRFARFLERLLGGLLLLALAVAGWVTVQVREWRGAGLVLPEPIPAGPPTVAFGAALDYQKAAEALPELSDEERERMRHIWTPAGPAAQGETAPAEANRALLARLEPVFPWLERAGGKPCRWADPHPEKLYGTPMGPDGFSLSAALQFRARLRLLGGDPTAADDLLRAQKLARDVGNAGAERADFTAMLLRIAMESGTLRRVLESLPELDAATARRLLAGQAALPDAPSFRAALAVENRRSQRLMQWIFCREIRRRQALGWRQALAEWLFIRWAPDAVVQQRLRQSMEQAKVGDELAEKSLEAWCNSQLNWLKTPPSQWLQWMRENAEGYAAYTRLLELPVPRQQPQREAMVARFKASACPFNTLADVDGQWKIRLQFETQCAVFRAALAAKAHADSGDNASTAAQIRAALKAIHNPHTDAPLEWRDVDGGIETEIVAAPDAKPLNIKVALGPPPK